MIMDRTKFTQYFACKLTQLMREKGHESSRSKAGIDIYKLAEISGCSYQMARKYALGLALPELSVIIKIADWLGTAPSLFLFDDLNFPSTQHKSSTLIEIEPILLRYILSKSSILFSLSNDTDSIINFIVETVYDAAHLDVDTKTIHKIIDMMISSATLLNKKNQDDEKHARIRSS